MTKLVLDDCWREVDHVRRKVTGLDADSASELLYARIAGLALMNFVKGPENVSRTMELLGFGDTYDNFVDVLRMFVLDNPRQCFVCGDEDAELSRLPGRLSSMVGQC